MSSLGAPSKAPGHPEPSLSSSRLSPKSRFVNQEQILWFLFRLSALHQACGICQLVTSLSPCVNLSCLCLEHQGHNLEALQHFQEKSRVVLALSQSRDAPVPRFPCATTTKIKDPRFAWFWNCGTISIVTFGMNLNFHRGRELGQHGSCEEPLQILAVPDPPCRKRVRAVSVVRAVVGTCPAGLSCAPLALPSQLGQLLGAAGRAEPAAAAAAAPSWRSASNKISRLFHGWMGKL